MLRLAIAALLLVSACNSAQAFFVVGAVVAAAGITGFAATIATAVGSLALSFGLSYAAGKLLEKDEPLATQPRGVGGNKIDLRFDADVPRSLLVGTAVTGGSLVYAQTYGGRGEIDNSDMIEMVALADHPCTDLLAVFIEGKEVDWTAAGAGLQNVDDYDDHVFFHFYNGTQVAADALAVSKLGTHSTQPWTAAMVGRGITYVMLHLIIGKKVTGALTWKFVVKGIKLYDPRKDTSVGGSGTHRFDILSTHEWSDNPLVISYNILRGIYVADSAGVRQHFYGLKRTVASQLPLTEWFAAMNACDEDMSATDTTNRYRAGGEITVDTEPREAIQELLKCCGGRIVELGGTYKPYIDTPELPVYSFTDDDILDEEDSFRPIMPLEQRVNYITGSYTSPTRWNEKIAPPRIDLDLEAEDGRRLPADLNAPFVQYGPQMQRLMRQYLLRSRRFRKHKLFWPPAAFHCEPGQVVLWNSARNGYIDKLFEIDSLEYLGNLCTGGAITEVDPNDYDWVDGFILDESDGDLPSTRPGPKVIGGFSAVGLTVPGDQGTKKPGILLTWTDPDDDDVTRVRVQVRRPTQALQVQNADSNEPESGKLVIVGGLAPLTLYEVRATFDSKNDYESDWSLWIPVTTPNALLSTKDFEAALRQEIETGINTRIKDLQDSEEILAGLLHELETSTALDKTELLQKIQQTKNQITAAYTNAITVATGPDSAIGAAITALEASVGDIKASSKAQFVVGVTPQGAIAAYDLKLVAEKAMAGMQIIAKSVNGVRSGLIAFDADSILFGKRGSNGSFTAPFLVDTTTTPPRLLINGSVLALSLKAATAEIGTLSAINADLGKINAGEILFSSPTGRLQITSRPSPQILISQVV